MDKLKVFSKKLGKEIAVSFEEIENMVTPDGVILESSDVVLAWNNSSSNWVDNGWNNSSSNWQNGGWNNSSSNWVNNGWNNSSSGWQNEGWNNSSANWGNSGNSGGGCYITTACVNYKGLKDDCEEMTILRKYRDLLIKEDESFRMKVLEYYRKAPLIVQCIETKKERDEILENIYQEMVLPCVSFLMEEKIDEAKEIYLNYYEKLSQIYLEG